MVEARACRIILDPKGLTQLAHADQLRPAETWHLLAYLAIDDSRSRAGRRHPLVAVPLIAAAAALAGARSIAAIAEWAADAPRASMRGSGPAATRSPAGKWSRPGP
jgi:hypothetical protein